MGGIICVISVLDEDIQHLKSYKINSKKLKEQLTYVFDKDMRTDFQESDPKYIVFAKGWENNFFEKQIRNKINLLACAVFFLRRYDFSEKPSNEKLIEIFLEKYKMNFIQDKWFVKNNNFVPEFNEKNIEENQNEFYKLRFQNTAFKSLTFDNILQKNAYEFSAAAHIQTLYAQNEIKKYFIYSDDELTDFYDFKTESITQKENNNSNPSNPNFSQIIYYGVPGSGKSHKIDEEIKSIPDTQKMRVVFHPDYSNADFVGQILPVMLDDGVEYRFKAGPFSRILKRALKNPSEPHYLIIEEINRGNAAAIFGDLFQLLDRSESGWSNYQIENLDLNAFIRSSDNTYSDKKIEPPTVKVGNDDWDENTGIRLPPNLSILATMNTSDQNVFTLDNAFQRRWDMQLVENNFGDSEEEKKQRDAKIDDSQITWQTFQTAINNKIGATSSEMGLSSLEDKRLGCWFVKNENGKIPKAVFANKVLKYLWDDAFKFSRDKIFENCSNFEELRNKFEQKGLEVFTQDLQNEFHKNKDSETSSE